MANQSNVLVPNASVSVFVTGTQILAPLFSDDGLTPKANPVITNSLGQFDFFIADGRYDFTVTGSNISTITVSNVEIADLTEASPSDSTWKTDNLNLGAPALPAATPPAGFMAIYPKISPKHLFVKDDAGNETDLFTAVGSGAQPPLGSLQYDNSGSLGGSNFIYVPNDVSGFFCPAPCNSLSIAQDSGFSLQSTDTNNFASMTVGGKNTAGAFYDVGSRVVGTSTAFASNYLALIGGANLGGGCFSFSTPTGSPPCALASFVRMGDIGPAGAGNAMPDGSGDLTNGQDAVGVGILPQMNKPTGHTMNNMAAVAIYSPVNAWSSAGPVAPTEKAVNLWGIEIQDLQGLGTTMTAGLHIEPQSNPGPNNFAVKTEVGAGKGFFADGLVTTAGTVATVPLAVSGISPGTNGQCVNTVGGVAVWGSCAGTAGVQTLNVNTAGAVANTATTNPQALETFTLLAGALNAIGKTFRLTHNGTVTVLNNSQNVFFRVQIGTVPFAGFSATVGGLLMPSTTTVGTYSIAWTCSASSTGTNATMHCGATGSFQGSALSNITFSLAGSGLALPVDLTSALTIGPTVQFQTTPSSSNVCNENMMVLEQLN